MWKLQWKLPFKGFGCWAWVERSGFGVQNSGLASELWEMSFLQSKKIAPLTFG